MSMPSGSAPDPAQSDEAAGSMGTGDGSAPVTPLRSVPASGRARAGGGEGLARDRVVIYVHPDLKQRIQYWAQRRDLSVSEYLADAAAEAIRRENQDYDLPTLETARLNQLVDEQKALSTNVANLERVITQGFDSIIGLTRGDNYLLDDEDGEL